MRSRVILAFARSALRLIHIGARFLDFFGTRAVLQLGQFGLQVGELAFLLHPLARGIRRLPAEPAAGPAFTLSPLSTPIQATLPITLEATSILWAATMYPVAVRMTCSPAEETLMGDCTCCTSTGVAAVERAIGNYRADGG